MTAVSLAFNGIQLNPINHNNQIWLTSVELAKSLGYAHENAVTKIFNRYKDEFTDTMSVILLATQIGSLGESIGLQGERRIFSLRGCHLLAMFSRTAIAKQFRVWVLDILDKDVGQPKRNGLVESPYLSAKDRTVLKDAVNKISYQSRDSHGTIYWRLFREYGVDKVELLPAGKIDEMLAFLGFEGKKLEQKATSQPLFKIPDGYALVDANWLAETVKNASLKYQFDDLKFVVEKNGGLVLTKCEVDRMKGVLKA